MVLKKVTERVSAKEDATMEKKGGRGRPKGVMPGQAGGIKRKHNIQETYSVYIYRVLKQVHPETGISKRSMSIMNSFINDTFERICQEAGKLVMNNSKHTLSSCAVIQVASPEIEKPLSVSCPTESLTPLSALKVISPPYVV